MPFQLTPLKLMPIPDDEDPPQSCLDCVFQGDPVPGGMITRLRAIARQQGKRVTFVLAEQASDKSTTLHARGDDKQLLLCLTGTNTSRNAAIAAFLPGMKFFHQKVLV
jgi:hypothetical protein